MPVPSELSGAAAAPNHDHVNWLFREFCGCWLCVTSEGCSRGYRGGIAGVVTIGGVLACRRDVATRLR